MTRWEYNTSPPYPEKKRRDYPCYEDDEARYISTLVIKDDNNTIDFKNDEDIYIEVNYFVPVEKSRAINKFNSEMCSAKGYMKTHKHRTKSFKYNIEFNYPFTIIVKSIKDRDLSSLSAKFIIT